MEKVLIAGLFILIVLIVINVVKLFTRCGNTDTLLRPLSDGSMERIIDFKLQNYPDFVAKVSGMSTPEPWGCWTDSYAGPVAKFCFKQALPKKITLEIAAQAFGPNVGLPVKVKVGANEDAFAIIDGKTTPYILAFETDGTADTLVITAPKPTSPRELDPNSVDIRKLGIGLISLKIKDGSQSRSPN